MRIVLVALLALSACTTPPPVATVSPTYDPRPRTAGEIEASGLLRDAGASYLQRSLDKTVIVGPGGRALTVPGHPGQGTHYIFLRPEGS